MRGIGFPLLCVLVSVGCIAVLVSMYPLGELLQHFARIDSFSFFLALVFVTSGLLLSTLRFHGLLNAFGSATGLRAAHRINVLSQIFGLFAFQSVGQILFRSTYGAYYVSQSERIPVITIAEKAIALLTICAFGLSGAIYVAHGLHVDAQRTVAPALVASSAVATFIAIWIAALSAGQRRYIRNIVRLVSRMGLQRATLISCGMNLLMLAAYMIIAHIFVPDLSLPLSASVFSVVMLTAAVPISFAGWGVREVSAGALFAILGLDPAVGVVVSAIVGIVSLIAIGFLGASLAWVRPEPVSPPARMLANRAAQHFERATAFVSGLLIAALIGFQVRIPIGQGELTVNLADPAVFAAAITLLLVWYRQYLHQSLWRVPWLIPALFAFGLMIAVGWAIGWARLGVVNWAWFNRGIGSLVLLAYMFAGAMFTAFAGPGGIGRLIRWFITAAVVSALVNLVVCGGLDKDSLKVLGWSGYNNLDFSGFLLNRNAMAFSMLLVMGLLLSRASDFSPRLKRALIVILLILIGITMSRAGIVVAMLLLLAMGVAGRLRWTAISRFVVLGVFGVALFVGAKTVMNEFVWPIIQAPGPAADDLAESAETLKKEAKRRAKRVYRMASRSSDERLTSMTYAIDMWLENPVFGAGMGAFVSRYADELPTAATIHNTVLWILAEMGLFGFVLFLMLPVSLLLYVVGRIRDGPSEDDYALLFVLAAIVMFSQLHDVLYQRMLWFVLGLLSANRLKLGDTLSYRMREMFR